ncbi:integral membrane protein [Rhodopirellula islandica]|uniref:Integral membrane protein n=1 Tax=Rhodopirellula islandica TaxID=595434 RepID=A0A0J1BGW5_RHOIS|nr:hypothetical protein [Rhodopirellula islandica]KLU05792.1 integral membrane protein [Rhodopirellula islandica]
MSHPCLFLLKLSACVLVAIALSSCVPAEEPSFVSVELVDKELNESSGLVFSLKDPSCIWSHNDSGDRARLFAFDAKTGQATGQWQFPGVVAVDWEDLAMLPPSQPGGPARLVIADCGDNQAKRGQIELLVVDEMDPRQSGEIQREQVRLVRVTYPDGAHDCEAIWFDEPSQELMLLCKRFVPWVGLYRVPLFNETTGQLNQKVTAELVTQVPIALATAADRDARTGDVWVATYWQAMKFSKADHASLEDQMAQTPTAIDLPKLKQVEAISVDSQSGVWVTSEGAPAPLVQLNVP